MLGNRIQTSELSHLFDAAKLPSISSSSNTTSTATANTAFASGNSSNIIVPDPHLGADSMTSKTVC